MKAYLVDISFSITVLAESEEQAAELAIQQAKDSPEDLDGANVMVNNADGSDISEEDEDGDFIHLELGSDFNNNAFPPFGSYILDINQTSTSPENFELSICEDGNGITERYNYDIEGDADKDLALFKSKMGIN